MRKIYKKIKIYIAIMLVFVLTINLYGCAQMSKNKTVKEAQTVQYKQETSKETIAKDSAETYAVKFAKEITALKSSFDSGETDAIKAGAGKAKELLAEAQKELAVYNKEVRDRVASMKSEVLIKRQNEYEEAYKSNLEQTETLLNQVVNADCAKDAKKALNELEELFAEEKTQVYSSEPENLAEHAEPETKEVKDLEEYETETASKAEPASQFEDNSELLELSGETALTEAIKEKAEELGTPLNIYNYLKNTIDYELYYGSRKGAGQTYATSAGNDKDQASLLIAMLRYLGYQARYAEGTILLTEKQVKNLTGCEDLKKGANVLASAGVPVTVLTEKGEACAVSMEHTWVEAYLPYTDYRGAGNNAGESVWIPLDTGIQEYKTVDTICDYCEEQNLTADWQTAIENGDAKALEELLEQASQNISEEDTQNCYLTSRVKQENKVTYLPLSLQYRVLEEKESYTTIAMEDSDTVAFSIAGKSLGTYKSSELLDKRITIEYVAETEDDQKAINQYGSIFEVPAYLVKMCPVLKLDGQEIARGTAAALGSKQNFTMRLHSAGETSEISNEVTAGSLYQVTLDAQTISSEELESAYEEYKALAETAALDNVYSEAYLGKVLDVAGKLYFAQLDIVNRILEEQCQVKATRNLSEGMTGYEVQTSSLYGTPVGLSEGSLYIDVDHDAHSAISRKGDKTAQNKFMRASGMLSSLYESIIWEELTGAESISTMSILNKAQEDGIDILIINQNNYENSVAQLEVDKAVLQDVKEAVRKGKEVTIPAKEVEIGSWSGSGYIVMDTASGAAAYMISGGLNGGSTSGIVTLEAMLGAVLGALVLAQLVTEIAALLTVAASLTVIGWLVLAMQLVALITTIMFLVELMIDYCDYIAGNEQAGDEVITATTQYAISILSDMLKDKMLKRLGLDVDEWLESRIFKNKTTDGPSSGSNGSGKGDGDDSSGNGKGDGDDSNGNGKGDGDDSNGNGKGDGDDSNGNGKGDGDDSNGNGKGDGDDSNGNGKGDGDDSNGNGKGDGDDSSGNGKGDGDDSSGNGKGDGDDSNGNGNGKDENGSDDGSTSDNEGGKYTEDEIQSILENIKGDGFKNNPLRQAYENEVAALKSYGEELLASGMSEEQVARTLNQARRDLGVKYKDMTPQPLRDYIYEINIGRYGDKLGPTYEWLVTEKGASDMEIIESASRPNSNIDKLLAGFEEWLRGQ